ncbi:MAG: heparan-alpha-glucosaminide N-acetyltransferase domain-containing protein [Paracoccaceae bacterium]
MASHALLTHLNVFAYDGPGWGWARPFVFAGRHSLAIYLIHQPILFAAFNVYGFFTT